MPDTPLMILTLLSFEAQAQSLKQAVALGMP